MAGWLSSFSWEELLLVAGAATALTVLTGLYFPKLAGEGGYGIIALEVAWTAPVAERILDRWRRENRLGKAKTNVEIDYAFIVFYSILGAVVLTLLARAAVGAHALSFEHGDRAGKAGALLFLVAGGLDAIENVGLLLQLRRERVSGALQAFSSFAASLKIVLLAAGLGLAVVLVGALATACWR